MGGFADLARKLRDNRPQTAQYPTEQTRPHYAAIEQQDRARDQWTELTRNQAEAIKRSEHLRSEINQALQRNDKPEVILLLALECIGLITGDSTAHRMALRGSTSPQDAPEVARV